MARGATWWGCAALLCCVLCLVEGISSDELAQRAQAVMHTNTQPRAPAPPQAEALSRTDARIVENRRNTSFTITCNPSYPPFEDVIISMSLSDDEVAQLFTDKVILNENTTSATVVVHGLRSGRAKITFHVSSSNPVYNISTIPELTVTFAHSMSLDKINAGIGWIYFLAWSLSFYPQVIENWQRKSVVGLNFDYIILNITGFLSYTFFNVGLFWVKGVQDAYLARHPGGSIPVQANDVFFAIHAVALTIIIIIQCVLYERGGQTVSIIAKLLVVIAWTFAGISLILTLSHKISWLTYLYYFSYIKLGVTLTKYIPQAYMNFKRKSTKGWSIGNVLLDVTGGTFSILQMILQAWNYSDWSIFYGDPVKFGLGLFSIFFDVIFLVQHYCLYPRTKQNELLVNEKPQRQYQYKLDTEPLLSSV